MQAYQMVTVRLEVTAEDGITTAYQETYERPAEQGTHVTYMQVINGQRGNWGYSGFASDAVFIDRQQERMRERSADAYRARVASRDREEQLRKFELLVPTLKQALDGLQAGDDIVAALRHGCEWFGLLPNLEALVMQESKKILRSTLRGAYSSARENVRESYEDEYRGADEKQDFYDEHADDIGQAIAQEI